MSVTNIELESLFIEKNHLDAFSEKSEISGGEENYLKLINSKVSP